MKTIRRYLKIAALVLVLLILGMTPAAQTPEQYIPFVGTGPCVDPTVAEKPIKQDKLDRKVDRFVSQLESDGFVVQEGHMGEFGIVQVCCAPNAPVQCVYANAASSYSVLYLPRSPGQTTDEFPYARDPEYPDRSLAWRLRPDEAVVFVGLTPPPMRYFGFQTYLFLTVDEQGVRVRSVIPMLILYFVAQKQLIGGIASVGLKG